MTHNVDWRSQHPSAVVRDLRRLWYGVEAEGPWRGKASAIIAAPPSADEYKELLKGLHSGDVEVVFFTETFEDRLWLERCVPDLCQHALLVWGRCVDQLGAYFACSDPVREHVRVMVRLFDAPWIERLSPQDMISVGEPYNMITFTVADAVRSVPEDYQSDVCGSI